MGKSYYVPYKRINAALAQEFGAGQVELRKAGRDKEYTFTLWFLNEDNSPETIQRAKDIVEEIEPAIWMDEKMFYS